MRESCLTSKFKEPRNVEIFDGLQLNLEEFCIKLFLFIRSIATKKVMYRICFTTVFKRQRNIETSESL